MALHGVVEEFVDGIEGGSQGGLVNVFHAGVMHIGVVDQRQGLIVVVMVPPFRRKPTVQAMRLDRLMRGSLQAPIQRGG
ncbi:hypothetical protein D3C85_1483790 [compost metagenome]